jgi:hypothetical protein
LGEQSLSFRFPYKTLHVPLLSPVSATCLAYLILLDLITRIILGEKYRWWSSSLCSSLNFPITSSLLGQMSSRANTLSLQSSITMTDRVSHQYKTDKLRFCTS